MALEGFGNKLVCMLSKTEQLGKMSCDLGALADQSSNWYVHPWSPWNGKCLKETILEIWLGTLSLVPDTKGQKIVRLPIKVKAGKHEHT